MKTIYIASSAWLGDQSRCERLAGKIVRTNPEKAESLILDAATVRREVASQSEGVDSRLIEIDFRTWVNETLTEGGVINIQAIRRSVTKMSEDKIFAINAIGFDANTIHRALTQLRIGFYTLTNWPHGLVLIGDDAQLHQVSPVLANTFYIQPSIVGKAVMASTVRQIRLDAFFLRVFGRRVFVFVNYLHKWITSRQQKKQQKEMGWYFEE
jgi:hypothetical protein